MPLKINDNINLPNSITAHNRISLKSVSVSGGGTSPEIITRIVKLERTVNKQEGAIEEMDHDLEGVHGTLEEVGVDITELDTAMSAAEDEIDAIHNKDAAQDAAIATKQDQLTFDASPTEDSNNPVTSDGIFKSLADVIEIAEGKTNSFTLSAQTVGNEAFNSQAGSIEVALFTDINGNEVAADKLKIGDIILVTELDVPDRWVGTVGETVTLYRMETAKVDLTEYYTKTEADALLAGKVDNVTLDNYATINYFGFKRIPAPTNTTLTNEQVEDFKHGVQIDGEFLGLKSPTFFPSISNDTTLFGFVAGYLTSNWCQVLREYKIQNNLITVDTYGIRFTNSTLVLDKLSEVNQKSFPNYPSDTAKTYAFEQNAGGTLAWNEKISYGFPIIAPPASTTLTTDEVNAIITGCKIEGTFLGQNNITFFAATHVNGYQNVNYHGIYISGDTSDHGGNANIGFYSITMNNVISLTRMMNKNLRGGNSVQLFAGQIYTSTIYLGADNPANRLQAPSGSVDYNRILGWVPNSGFTWLPQQYGPSVSDDAIAELTYEKISSISLSADRTFTLKTAQTDCIPEYKALITNSSASAITLTFTGVGTIHSNDPNIVLVAATNSTATIPANTKVEVNIFDGDAIIYNKGA